ncbi:CoA transferase [Myxococcota bacterium]|nr:CoA transferase [Myxococcota bacterium]
MPPTQDTPMPLCLSNLRVVELGYSTASGLVGMMLAEQGAEVLQLLARQDGHPVERGLLSRGKAEAVVDLEDPQQRRRVEDLLAHADVVLDHRVAGGHALGPIDIEALRAARNPGLIVGRVTAFPEGDPRASLPGYPTIAGAAGGLYEKPIGAPKHHAFPVASVMSALYLANGVVAALIAQARDGRGQEVTTSLFEASAMSQVLQVLVKSGIPRGFLPLKMIGSPFMRVWACKDARYVYLHITLPSHNEQMLRLLKENGYRAEVERLRGILSAQTISDPSQVGSIAEAKKIKAIYEQIFRDRPADEWERLLGDHLCCIKVRSIEEWLDDSRADGLADAVTVEDPVLGALTVPGPVVDVAGVEARATPRVILDDHAAEIAARWAEAPRPTPEEIAARPVDARPPLAGIKVVDLSRIIAGPASTRTLAELGAEVVTLQGSTLLDWALSFHLVFNAGKRSATLDLRAEGAKETFWRLLEDYQPDVLVQNFRHLDVAKAIGINPDAVHERHPALIYTHLNAYGNHGEWQNRPGFEQVVQAVSGIQMSYAQGQRPKLLPSPVIDIGCGLLGAYGTLLGLYRRTRTGQRAFVNSHLTTLSVLLQLHDIAAHQARRDVEDEAEIIDSGIVKTSSGWVAVAGPRGLLRRWMGEAGWAEVAEAEAPFEALRRALRRRKLPALQADLAGRDYGDAIALMAYPKVSKMAQLVSAYDDRPIPFVSKRPYPGVEMPLAFVSSPLRLSHTPLPGVAPAPLPGTHTEEVLGHLRGEAPATPDAHYPEARSLIGWATNLARWGYFAWKSGNI